MSVRKYNNKYRAAVSVAGNQLQVYFDTREQAEAFVKTCKEANFKNALKCTHRRIRSDKRDTSLPVGLFDSIPKTEFMKNGRKTYCTMNAHVTLPDGTFKQKNVTYGTPRTRNREQAIKLALQWRTDTIKIWVITNGGILLDH